MEWYTHIQTQLWENTLLIPNIRFVYRNKVHFKNLLRCARFLSPPCPVILYAYITFHFETNICKVVYWTFTGTHNSLTCSDGHLFYSKIELSSFFFINKYKFKKKSSSNNNSNNNNSNSNSIVVIFMLVHLWAIVTNVQRAGFAWGLHNKVCIYIKYTFIKMFPFAS